MARSKEDYSVGDFFVFGTDPLSVLYDYVTAPSAPGGQATPVDDDAETKAFFSDLAFAFCNGVDVVSGEQLVPPGQALSLGQKAEQVKRAIDLERTKRALTMKSTTWLDAIDGQPDEKLIAAITNLGVSARIGACAPPPVTGGGSWPLATQAPRISLMTIALIGGGLTLAAYAWKAYSDGKQKPKKKRKKR